MISPAHILLDARALAEEMELLRIICSVLLCVASSLLTAAQDDVVGCGGFVRSKFLSNFSRIKVNTLGALYLEYMSSEGRGEFLMCILFVYVDVGKLVHKEWSCQVPQRVCT